MWVRREGTSQSASCHKFITWGQIQWKQLDKNGFEPPPCSSPLSLTFRLPCSFIYTAQRSCFLPKGKLGSFLLSSLLFAQRPRGTGADSAQVITVWKTWVKCRWLVSLGELVNLRRKPVFLGVEGRLKFWTVYKNKSGLGLLMLGWL